MRKNQPSEAHLAWTVKTSKKVTKKYRNKGIPSFVLHKRVVNTATNIVGKLDDVPFENLTLSLYIICKDTGFPEFVHKYEAVIELAKADKEAFVNQLYKFYDNMGKYIKENNYNEKFMSFLAFFNERQEFERDEVKASVYSVYMDLLLEQVEFLRPDKYAYNDMLAGIDTEGNPIVIRDPFPAIDLAVYDVEDKLTNSYLDDAMRWLSKSYAKYGYKGIDTLKDAELLRTKSQVFCNNVYSMMAFINEYNVDILPEKPINTQIFYNDWPDMQAPEVPFEDILLKRKRTLPANGLTVTFEKSRHYESILFKEIHKNNAIYMLYRLRTSRGDISGYYNTKTKIFYVPFESCQEDGLYLRERIKNVVLWAYAAYVCNAENVEQTSESYLMYTKDRKNTLVSFYSIGGRLSPVWHKKSDAITKHRDSEKYQQKPRSIAGYVRALPAGQKASERSVMLAESLGFDLGPGETYVQSFIRQSWILKEK